MSSSLPELVVEPPRKWVPLNLHEIWDYRYMIYYLSLRNITANYKQSVLGPLWVIINPVVSMIIYTFIFGVVVEIGTSGVPYPIFNYTALIPWGLFIGILGSTTSSIAGQVMINKVYFPRLVLPLVEVAMQMVNFLLTFLLLFVLMVYYQIAPTINIVFLPFFTLLAVLFALGAGLVFAPLQVRSRDVGQLVGYIGRFWLYITPVLYPRDLFPHPWDQVALLNPATSVIEGFRWALLGTDPPALEGVVWTVVSSIVLFYIGAMFFRRSEHNFADIA